MQSSILAQGHRSSLPVLLQFTDAGFFCGSVYEAFVEPVFAGATVEGVELPDGQSQPGQSCQKLLVGFRLPMVGQYCHMLSTRPLTRQPVASGFGKQRIPGSPASQKGEIGSNRQDCQKDDNYAKLA